MTMRQDNNKAITPATFRQRKIRTYSNNTQLVAEKRKLIAHHALRLFLKKGYHRTTMKDLAKACKLAEGAIYRYIGSKEDILHLFLQDTTIDAIQDRTTSLGDIGTVGILRECIRTYFTWQDQTRDRNIFYNREINNFAREDRAVLLKSQSDYILFFEDLIKRGVEEGKFKTRCPLLVAHNIVMMGFDWSLRKWFLGRHFTLDEYIKLQTETILQVLMQDSIAAVC